MDVVGEVVQRVDRCAVEVLDCGEVDGKPWPPASGLCGGGGERLVEAVDVAEVDFPAAMTTSVPSSRRVVSRVSDVAITRSSRLGELWFPGCRD